MAPHKTITINGRIYDAATGLPVNAKPAAQAAAKPASTPAAKPVAKTAPKPVAAITKPAAAAARAQTAAGAVHANVQRSQTLHRRAAKKPAVPNKPVIRRPTTGRQMDIARNTNVAKFAPHPVAKPVAIPKRAKTPDRPAQVHPTAARALQKTAAKNAVVIPKRPATSKEVKDAAIERALAMPKAPAVKLPKKNKWTRRIVLASSIAFVLAAVLFAVYKFIPSVSVNIASAQAGISATYPEYTPDGFSLSQPVTYSDGKVDLTFKSNSNDNYYSIAQTRSSWDSSAVLDNVVEPVAGANYVTTKERGLTIYTYNKSAAWVNGGILYEINSNAPLSGDQIRRIATSL